MNDFWTYCFICRLLNNALTILLEKNIKGKDSAFLILYPHCLDEVDEYFTQSKRDQ